MEWEDWKHWYDQIVANLDLDPEKDREAAQALSELLDQRSVGQEHMEALIRGKETVVFGPAPFTGVDIKDKVWISAGSSTAQLIEKEIWPNIVVTDLDGDVPLQVEANRKGAVIVIHAHGDNIQSLKEWVPRFSMPLMGTTQVEPTEQLPNFGGFTDGDRAVFLAVHFGARRIFLEGFDYEQPMGKPHVDIETKLLKLKYARQLIDYAARQYDVEIVQGL